MALQLHRSFKFYNLRGRSTTMHLCRMLPNLLPNSMPCRLLNSSEIFQRPVAPTIISGSISHIRTRANFHLPAASNTTGVFSSQKCPKVLNFDLHSTRGLGYGKLFSTNITSRKFWSSKKKAVKSSTTSDNSVASENLQKVEEEKVDANKPRKKASRAKKATTAPKVVAADGGDMASTGGSAAEQKDSNLEVKEEIEIKKVSKNNSKAKKLQKSSEMCNGTVGTNFHWKMKPLYPPSGKSVVVVESLTKAQVIQRYLGDMFEVLPSYGHVRDLAVKSQSVRPNDDFSMVWEVPTTAWTHLKSIKVALNGADNLILASDPDREGEAIAWHIMEMLQQQNSLKGIALARVVFYEITEMAVKHALQNPRDIDVNLVNAYLARRALDYLIGFGISPLLWRKLPSCRSAGRVQSAALSLICDREMEIEQFSKQQYWTILADFQLGFSETAANRCFPSQLTHYKSKKLEQLSIGTEKMARAIEKNVLAANFKVKNVKTSAILKSPPIPYITSTLQQDAANKLHFTASHTMKLAQKLYEGVKLSDEETTGLITYMRTDGLHISSDAAQEIHSLVKERYGEAYASKSLRKYFKKVKNAQEAHEAIRPTDIRRLPSNLIGRVDGDALKLYTLIWQRTVACQMESSKMETIQVDFGNADGDITFHSTGSRVAFPGYRAAYKDKAAGALHHDEENDDMDNNKFDFLSKLKVKDSVLLLNIHLQEHYTKPPPRFSEGALVKKLEELGIGRPSTYASTIKVLQDRKYVTMVNRSLHPEFRGRMLSAFLSHFFSEIADYSFTADLENELDNVSAGVTEWKGLLRDYWTRFTKYCDLVSCVDTRQLEKIFEKKFGHILFSEFPENSRVCPSCSEGTLRFKVSSEGAGFFIGCDQFPRCKYIAGPSCSDDDENITPEKLEKSFPPRLLGHLPENNEKVYLKNGPYGYYIQLGEDKKGKFFKRVSLPEAKDINSITLKDAIEVLQYPRSLGNHPVDGQQIVLTYSKGGFSIKHRQSIASVPKDVDPKSLTMEAALKLLMGGKVRKFGRPKMQSKSEEVLLD